jgi:ABC-2 type transport system ATP-binding protein
MAVIATANLSKNYKRIQALRGVSIGVEKGEIYGLLGQNGAGKTTLIKVLLGLISGWEGEAHLLGKPAGRADIRARVGYLPEDHRFPDYHTGYSLLDFYCQLLGVARAERRRRIPEMLELVGLKGRMHYKIRTYSKGMKQRMGIAQAIVHDPDVVFLDEPTDGVDPIGRREIRELMQKLKDRGVTIFLNSHLLSEVEQICDRVAILQQGQVIREGSIAELTRQRGLFQVGLARDQVLPREELIKVGFDAHLRGEYWEIGLHDGQSIDFVIDLARRHGLSIRHLVEKRQTLEELFMKTVDAVEPGVDQRAGRSARAAK